MGELLRRLWYAVRRRRFEADLAEEMNFHRAMKQREIEAQGVDARAASFAARRALGSVALAQDHSRDVWLPRWLQGTGQDLRLAVRALWASPIVSMVAVLSLALGIGANTAIFSLVNSLLLRALPVAQPQRLVAISSPRAAGLGSTAAWSYPIWKQVEQRPALFDGALAWSADRFNLAQGGETQFVDGLWVSGSFFHTLGVSPSLGRLFTESDDRRGGGPNGAVAVLSYGYWQRRFGGAADAVGRTLTIENVPFTVVGVAPPDFFGTDVGRTFDVAVPLGDDSVVHGGDTRLDRRNYNWLSVTLRLKATQTIESANAALRSVQPQIREATLPDQTSKEYLDQYLTGREGFTLVPAGSGNVLRRRYRRPLVTIMVVVALVLLIACANIANLQLARATARRHELSVRRALGASRWRLARQLFAESVVLATMGAAVGLVIASWVSRLLVHQLSTETNTVFLNLSLDPRVLIFTIVVTMLTTLIFGIGPALPMSNVVPVDALKEFGRGTSGEGRVRLGSGLVVAQVALSVVLVVAAGLFIRSFTSLTTRDLGFERDRVLVVNINTQHAAADLAQRFSMSERALEAVHTLPGVTDAALSVMTPVQNMGLIYDVEMSGGAIVPKTFVGGIANAYGNTISPDWFRTLGIPLVAGRDFTEQDRKGTPAVAIVNQALARAFLNGASPLGRTLTLWLPRDTPLEIVGVVGDSVYGSLREAVPPTVYTPFARIDGPPLMLANVSLSIRASGAPSLLANSVTSALQTVDPRLALTFRPLADQVNASLVQERLVAMLSGFFGGLALLLAGLGLYGVTSYSVARRRAELGIRMALGAAPRAVVRLVLSRVAMLVGTGVVAGAVFSLWASQFVAALLYGLQPRDPATLVGAALTLAAVAGLAAWLPAWHASRIDPAVVLRDQ